MEFKIEDGPIPLPPDFKADVQKAADIAMKALGLTDSPATVVVSFMPRPDGEASLFGEYEDATNKFGINLNPICGMQWPQLIERLCHELVHVKQIVSGELKFDGDDATWHGTQIKGFDVNDVTSPWEKDADERGKPIFAEVKRQAST